MSDAVVWEIINHGHCSFKAKTVRQNFCRNEYNVSGLCNKSSCPLANSRYATIREDKGRVYLCIKTIERSHTPKKLWQRIRLSRKYMTALQQVDEHLAHWPKFLVHKNKQRLTKITQYLIRLRKLALKPQKKLVTQPARLKKQEKRKEAKAEKAADIEASIEKELLNRLESGTYGDIYNFPMAQYNKVLDKRSMPDTHEEAEAEGDEEAELEVETEGEEEMDSDDEEHMDFVEDLEESDDEDIEDIAARLGSFEEDSGESGSEEDGVSSGSDDADAPGPSSKQGRAPKRRPKAPPVNPRKRNRGLELEIEHEQQRVESRQ